MAGQHVLIIISCRPLLHSIACMHCITYYEDYNLTVKIHACVENLTSVIVLATKLPLVWKMFGVLIVGIGSDKWGRDIGGAQENSRETARCRADRENEETAAGLFQSQLQEEEVSCYSSVTAFFMAH